MKKKLIIGVCFIAIIILNILVNINTDSSSTNLASLLSITTANAEGEYGNGLDATCWETGCPSGQIMITCFSSTNHYCSPTSCSGGWCDND